MMDDKFYPIIDLHCDLLSHLAKEAHRLPGALEDVESRCSLSALRKGNVKLQTMAIFTETSPNSLRQGMAQANVFKELKNISHGAFTYVKTKQQLDELAAHTIGAIPAIENASSLCDEREDLEIALKRLSTIQHKIGKFAYVTLTWNTENRFGGGAATSIGLKPDGRRLIDYLAEHSIAIDFSHTSDPLAFEIFNYLDKANLKVPLLDSHSNMRKIHPHFRNLSDEIAKEILHRGGIIGMSFIKTFIGEEGMHRFTHHLAHLFALGGMKQVCFGADFFNENDLSTAFKSPSGSFYKDFGDASCYPSLLQICKSHLFLSEDVLCDIAWNNVLSFLKSYYF